MKLIWLWWWSCLLACAHSSPGVIMRVTQKWLEYIRSEGVEVFRHTLLYDPFPDMIGTTRMFGKVEYEITGIRIEELNILNCTAVPVPPSDVDVNAGGVTVKVNGHWKVHHWLIKDSGTFFLALSEVSLVAKLATLRDSSLRPSVSISACHSEVAKAKLHLSGGASWFYNLFTFLLEKPIRNKLNEKLCPRVNDVIKILQTELATFQVSANLNGNSTIDYSLMSPPHVQKTYIDLDLMGIIHGSQKEQDPNAGPITVPNSNSSMILVAVSETFFNNLGKAYFMDDILKLTLTHQQFPGAFWLRTDDYGAMIPEMRRHYPVSEAMVIRLKATKPPIIHLKSQMLMELEGTLKAMVVLPYLITKEVFSANVKATFYAYSMQLMNLKFVVSFVMESFNFSNFSSQVGYVHVSELEKSLGFSLKQSVLLAINNGLRDGIPMPILANISLQDSSLQVTPGCLLASMDMYYIPWKELLAVVPKHQS